MSGETAAASFETVYRDLEETVRRLDAGGQTLDEAINLYESGMRLAKQCQELLDAAELRIINVSDALAATDVADDADYLDGDDDNAEDEDDEDGEVD